MEKWQKESSPKFLPEHPDDQFIKVGENLLRYEDDEVATSDEAKSRCESYNSTLVEFRDEQEFNEVHKG